MITANKNKLMLLSTSHQTDVHLINTLKVAMFSILGPVKIVHTE